MNTTKIALFKGKQIRKTLHNDEWWFSIIDIIEVLTDSNRPRKYWNDLKSKLHDEGYIQLSEKIGQLKLISTDGKKYATDCTNTETMLRIIQSIPSKKAEPLKRWLAKIGYERIQEIENPEIAMQRMQTIYEKKGYSKNWIDKRMRGIAVRQDLTDEWKERGATTSLDYAILTNEIIKGTFGMKVDEYKEFKSLKRENLRDHMTDLELILTMLGEATTTKITKDRDSKKFKDLKKDASDGGKVAGRTRKDIEKQSNKKVISNDNYTDTKESQKRFES
ncbi:MAG: Bro-N domain-containing protein [Candidatus Magasanikbacteria bacterium]|jgi:DNA-damage-inducible protein D|nr:Bro-N domain-containing protein [Candidatus Magasanikbacteria bacterium]MBT4071993.1 Bro-N domain-containing protein [Candidatus Magasanikbacteria bacterium]